MTSENSPKSEPLQRKEVLTLLLIALLLILVGVILGAGFTEMKYRDSSLIESECFNYYPITFEEQRLVELCAETVLNLEQKGRHND